MSVKTLKSTINVLLIVIVNEEDIRYYDINDNIDNDIANLQCNTITFDEDAQGKFCQVTLINN